MGKKIAQKSVDSHVGKTGLGRPGVNAISAYGSEQMRKIKRKLNGVQKHVFDKILRFWIRHPPMPSSFIDEMSLNINKRPV